MGWQLATLITKEQLATDIVGLTFSLSQWQPHLPGQHYLLRLVGDMHDIRQYSAVSTPAQQGVVEFAVQVSPTGRISPQLAALQIGEQIELQLAPVSDFVWHEQAQEPLVVIAGGCGLAPLMSMLRQHFTNYSPRQVVALVSVRSPEHFLYQNELESFAKTYSDFRLVVTYTQKTPAKWNGYARRIDQSILQEALGAVKNQKPRIYVCGSTPFVETITQNLLIGGFDYDNVFAERFGGEQYEF